MPDPKGARSPGSGRGELPDLLARNSLLNVLGLGLPLLVAVFAIPPIVEGMGPERFGLLGLIWVATAYLALLDLGLGRATTRYAAAAIAAGERDRLQEIVGVAAVSQLVLGLAGGAAAAVLAGPLVTRFLDLGPALRHEAIWSFIGLAAAAPAVAITNSFRGVLEADQRFGLINAVRVPISALNFLIPLVGVWLGWSLPMIVAWLVVSRVAGLLAYASACLRQWPVLRRPLRLRGERLRELAGFGGWVTVSAVVSGLLVYIDRFFVGGVDSVEAAGYYTVPHEMVTRLEILPASLVLTLFPALSALSGPGSAGRGGAAASGGSGGVGGERAALIYRSVEYLLTFVAPLLLTLAVLSGDVLTLWLGPEFAARADAPLRILALGMLVNALAFVPAAALQAAGRPDLTARFHLIELPVHLVLLWVLVSRWGTVGAAAAWTTRTALDAGLLFGAVAYLRLAPVGGWTRSRAPVLIGALGLFMVAAVAAAALVSAPLQRVALVAALLLLWGAWAWHRLLGGGERTRLLRAAGLRR